MKLKILKKMLCMLCLCTAFVMVTSFYNFVSGFSIITTVKTRRYNARRAHYYKMLEEHPEQFQLKTEDNITISGLLVDRPEFDSILLICHGYKQSKEHLSTLANLFSEFTVVLFDLRAHGDSEGNLVSFGYHEYKDVSAVLNFLKNDERFNKKKIYGLGISMGAASIANAASRGCVFDGLILDSCFSSIDFDVVTKFIRIPKIFFHFGKCIFRYCWGVDIDSVQPGIFLSSIKCPVMILHSELDEKIGISHAHELFSRLSCENKALVLCKGAHGQIFREDTVFYKKAITDFIAKI